MKIMKFNEWNEMNDMQWKFIKWNVVQCKTDLYNGYYYSETYFQGRNMWFILLEYTN